MQITPTDNNAAAPKLADLTLEQAQEDVVKGGLLLPAVQKVSVVAAHSGGSMGAGKVVFSDLS